MIPADIALIPDPAPECAPRKYKGCWGYVFPRSTTFGKEARFKTKINSNFEKVMGSVNTEYDQKFGEGIIIFIEEYIS